MSSGEKELTQSTRVSFPSGEVVGDSNIVAAIPFERNAMTAVIARETPFYPVSHSWPDQEADRGHLVINGHSLRVVDVVTAAREITSQGSPLLLGTDIPVRKFEDSWGFFVAHVVELPDEFSAASILGAPVALVVDKVRRRLLSASHTATHLAGLALNKACAELWRKEAGTDGMQHPDLDKLGIQSSHIGPGSATDRYRLGKSLRKRGFNAEAFYAGVEEIDRQMNLQLASWLATAARVAIEIVGPALDDPRTWVCSLDGTSVRFPCGGTHVSSLGDLERVTVDLAAHPDDQGFVMSTVAQLAPSRAPAA